MSIRGAALGGVIAVLLAVAGSFDFPPQASADARWLPRDFTLRLADLGPGYRLGNDASCDLYFDDEKGPPNPRDLDYLFQLYNECGVDFREMWTPPGEDARPQSIESYAWILPDTKDAAREFRRWRRSDPRVGSKVEVGDAALLYGEDGNFELRWRSGRILARVLTDGFGVSTPPATVLSLARRQQRRIVHRSRLRPRHLYDATAGLDDPEFGVPVIWLGRHFRPGRGLPPLQLTSSSGGGGDFDTGVGWTGELHYGTEPFDIGVIVGIWEPDVWQRSARRRFGRLLWASRCAKVRRFQVRGSQVAIYAAHATAENRCDGRRRNAFMAIVRRDGVVVTVNMPLCYTCRFGGPYNSFKGLEALTKGLRLRQPTV